MRNESHIKCQIEKKEKKKQQNTAKSEYTVCALFCTVSYIMSIVISRKWVFVRACLTNVFANVYCVQYKWMSARANVWCGCL